MSNIVKMTYREAVRVALREALKNNANVFLMGEDVGRYGGAYACSKGLLEEFGEERVRHAARRIYLRRRWHRRCAWRLAAHR